MSMQSSEPQSILIKNVEKRFGAFQAIRNLSLDIAAGEFVTFLGPSGCGKSTTLKILAGLLAQDSGEILFGERRIDMLPANKRNIGLVFQNYALFPHMTVGENIEFGLKMRGWGKQRRNQRIDELLALVRLEGLAARKPEALSGGQQQRVAVARALAFNPDLVLLDEPLSNLDAKLREQVRIDLRNIQREAGQTTVFVTHDQVEALVMSDRIVLMNRGGIEQIATPTELYSTPHTEFGARFVGANNLIEANIKADGEAWHATVDSGRFAVSVDTVAPGVSAGQNWLCVRPEDIVLGAEDRLLRLKAKIVDQAYQGTTMLMDLDVEGLGLLRAERPVAEVAGHVVGQDVTIGFTRTHVVAPQDNRTA